VPGKQARKPAARAACLPADLGPAGGHLRKGWGRCGQARRVKKGEARQHV
jgi:hypothetical protein